MGYVLGGPNAAAGELATQAGAAVAVPNFVQFSRGTREARAEWVGAAV